MSRYQYFTLTRNGSPVEFLTGSIRLRMSATSRAEFSLPADELDWVTLDDADVYELKFVQETAAGVPVPTSVLVGALAREATYQAGFRAPVSGGPGEVRTVRTLVLQDAMWAFADDGPTETITHTDTNLEDQLQFIAGQMQIPSALTTTPNVLIPRIDYTRQSGFWQPLTPYMAPFEPVYYVDPASGAIRVYDTTSLHAEMPRATRVIGEDDWNDIEPTVSIVPVETQFLISYISRGGDEGPSPVLVPQARNTRTTDNEDGGKTTSWDQVGYLYENPDTPDVPTREIPMGNGQTVTNRDHQVTSRVVTSVQYQDDYTRTYQTTTVTEERCSLPLALDILRETERIVVTTYYKPHPTIPDRKVIDRKTRVTSGLYVFTYTGTDAENGDRADIKASGAALKPAAWNRLVSSAQTSSLRWGQGLIATFEEKYNRSAGSKEVHIQFTDTDNLREILKDSGSRTEQDDASSEAAGYARVEYYPPVVTGRQKTAKPIDASRIGREAGVALAQAKLARSGQADYEIRLPLTRPDYQRYRLGWVVTLDETTPYNLAGRYLCNAVDFTIHAADETGRNPIDQVLTLERHW